MALALSLSMETPNRVGFPLRSQVAELGSGGRDKRFPPSEHKSHTKDAVRKLQGALGASSNSQGVFLYSPQRIRFALQPEPRLN